MLVSWLTGNLFLTSVLWFCSLLVFQRRSWTVPQMSLYKYTFVVCVCCVAHPSHPYSVTKVEDEEKKSKNNPKLVWKLPLMMSMCLALCTLCFPWRSADTGMWCVTESWPREEGDERGRGGAAGPGSVAAGVVGHPGCAVRPHRSALSVLCPCRSRKGAVQCVSLKLRDRKTCSGEC